MRTIMRDAEALALFSNAGTAPDVDYFRGNYRGFFPQHFWEYRDYAGPEREAVPVWQGFQRRLREGWQEGFPLEKCISLITSALGSIFEVMEAEGPGLPVWPYQRAVMFLGVEPWRARFCPVCSRRFVADKPGRRFCSAVCSGKARRASKKAWWGEHGEEWRADYEQKKAERNAKGKRSRRVRR